MPAYDKLQDDELRLLAQQVLEFRREGLRNRLVELSNMAGESLDEESLEKSIEYLVTPGEGLRVPQIGPVDTESARRGRESFQKQGCKSCHGDDGRGVAQPELFDDNG